MIRYLTHVIERITISSIIVPDKSIFPSMVLTDIGFQHSDEQAFMFSGEGNVNETSYCSMI